MLFVLVLIISLYFLRITSRQTQVVFSIIKIENANSKELCFASNIIIAFILYIIWIIVDIVLFGVNDYLDVNGAPLKDWNA